MCDYEECVIDLTGEVRARIGNIVKTATVGLLPGMEERASYRKPLYEVSEDERVLSVHPDGGGAFYIEFKNGGTINIVGDECSSIDIAYTDRPEIAEEKSLPSELDGCYVTLSSIPKWAKKVQMNGAKMNLKEKAI